VAGFELLDQGVCCLDVASHELLANGQPQRRPLTVPVHDASHRIRKLNVFGDRLEAVAAGPVIIMQVAHRVVNAKRVGLELQGDVDQDSQERTAADEHQTQGHNAGADKGRQKLAVGRIRKREIKRRHHQRHRTRQGESAGEGCRPPEMIESLRSVRHENDSHIQDGEPEDPRPDTETSALPATRFTLAGTQVSVNRNGP
jgi:hypothetical protein